jgi:hypothetical protein
MELIVAPILIGPVRINSFIFCLPSKSNFEIITTPGLDLEVRLCRNGASFYA